MADGKDKEFESWYHIGDGEPVGRDEAPGDCPACRGTGKLMLLVSATPCQACGGTGKIAGAHRDAPEQTPAAGSEVGVGDDKNYDAVDGRTVESWVPGCWVITSTFDGENRLRSRTERFVRYPPGAEAANGA